MTISSKMLLTISFKMLLAIIQMIITTVQHCLLLFPYIIANALYANVLIVSMPKVWKTVR